MRSLPPSALAVGLLLLAPGCHRRVTRAECDAMLDRYVDMTLGDDPALAKVPPEQRAEASAAALADKREQPEYRRREAQCLREVGRDEYDCAMKAPTPNEWEACIE